MKSGDLKLEHGKKYVQYTGAIVGPILELSDGRFSWAPYIWDSTGKILANDGLTKNQSALCSISHEYVERKPDAPINPETIAAQYAHKKVGIGVTVSSPAAMFLDKVRGIVTGPREKEYGDKTQNHQRIADLWNMWLNETKADSSDQITAYDVAMMMILVKIARLMNTPGHQDSHIDLAGYASILEEIANG